MPNHTLRRVELLGFLFVSAAGSLAHFVYGWSGGSLLLAPLVPINESVFEHLKLLFFPHLLFTVGAYLFVRRREPSYLPARAAGVLWGMAVIVAVYYVYTGIIGTHFLWADILTFLLGGAAAALRCLAVARSGKWNTPAYRWAALALLVGCAACFAAFTFAPPHLALFQDPTAVP